MTSTTATGSSVGGSIVIRQYEPKDHEQVLALFRRGMQSLVPQFTRNMLTDPYVFVPVGGVTTMIQLGLSKAVSLLMPRSPKTQPSRPSAVGFHQALFPALGSASFVLLSVLVIYRIGCAAMDGYIHRSMATDLADISRHYLHNGGTFLVAEEAASRRIVGIVGGEKKNDESDAQQGKFELRRMSVDRKIQRQGLGRRLTRRLEETLQKSGCRQLFLTTSSLQTSANHLYTKTGFTLTRKTQPASTIPFVIRRAIQFHHFEKHYEI